MEEGKDWETEAYLARIRRTIAESHRLVEQVGLRVAETDRLLESQGLTREQVMNIQFTEAQREAVNAELRRRGLEPVDWEEIEREDMRREIEEKAAVSRSSSDAELAERQRKFGMMMKPFQL